MIWVTRVFVHVDRVACPWLIKHFIDKDAQFIFLPKEEILPFVEKTGAIAFDLGGVKGAKFDHYEKNNEKYCTFDALIEHYNLKDDEGLQQLRKIVRAADCNQLEKEKLAWGLEAVATGAPLLANSDHEVMEKEFPFYDMVYAYIQQQIVIERNKKEYEQIKSRSERMDYMKKQIAKLKTKMLK